MALPRPTRLLPHAPYQGIATSIAIVATPGSAEVGGAPARVAPSRSVRRGRVPVRDSVVLVMPVADAWGRRSEKKAAG